VCQVLSTKDHDLWHYTTPTDAPFRQAVAFMYPYWADKSTWPHKPDVQAWDGWPVRQPSLLFAGLALTSRNISRYGRNSPPIR